MTETQVREALSALGFSEKAIEAYLAVLERGSASMRTVSEAASVSQSYVYEIAGDLADRGLVTVDESASPTVLRARPPEEVTDLLAGQVEAFEDAATAVYSEADRTEPGFEVIRSPQTVRRRLARHVEAAEHEVILAIPGEAIETVREELAAAVERGVTVYCMLTGPEAEAGLESVAVPGEGADPNAHVVRTWRAPAPMVLVRDVHAGVHGGPGLVTGRPLDDEYAIAFDELLVGGNVFGSTVGNHWPMGDQRAVTDPPELPATYEHFRSGVTCATLHDHAGTDLVVDLEPIELATGERRRFEGVPVREVRQSLIEPRNSEFPLENALVVETGEGTVSVGAGFEVYPPWFEEYAAQRVTVRRA